MRYGSVCSGIEAASCAWEPLGFTPAWFSEIAPFPSKFLATRFPHVPNHGSLIGLADRLAGDARRIDLLVGGTPCQSFSIAGLRGGLADDRGNLTLQFARLAAALRPRWVLWENVPGVLSDDTNAFGCLLGALCELGYGCAWRVLDAQFFGVAQRRERVFLVGHLGAAAAAGAVLFEPEGVRRNPPTRRKAREDVAGTLGGGSGRRGWAPDTDRMTFVPEVSGTLRTRGDNAEDPWNGRTLLAGREPWTLASGQANAPTLEGQAPTLTCLHEAPIVAFDPTQITSPGNRSSARGDTSPTLAKSARPPHFAIGRAIVPGGRFTREAVEHLFDDEGRRVPLRGPPISVEHAGQILDANSRRAIAFNARQDPVHSTTTTGALDTDATSQAVCVTGPIVNAPWCVRRLTPRECERLQGFPDDTTAIPGAKDSPRYAALGNSMAVPVMRWIGQRIALVDSLLKEAA